jgi:hypothetical protein
MSDAMASNADTGVGKVKIAARTRLVVHGQQPRGETPA